MDAQTLQTLIDAHGAALTLYARQWCRDPEDAVQEAFVEMVRQDPVPDQPVGWLYTAVRRRAMNAARAESRRAKHQRQAGTQREPWFVPAEHDWDFESLLSRLPRLEREIVVARIWGERSFAEVATIVEQPVSTVHRRYQGALAELERMMNEIANARSIDERTSPLS